MNPESISGDVGGEGKGQWRFHNLNDELGRLLSYPRRFGHTYVHRECRTFYMIPACLGRGSSPEVIDDVEYLNNQERRGWHC